MIKRLQYLIGIDAGTTSVKVAIFSSTGEEVTVSSVENQTITTVDNHSEQDMNILWKNTQKALSEAINKSGIDPKDIISIGITGQGEGCWLLDKNGDPCRLAILWNDARAFDFVINLPQNTKDLIKNINGSIPGTGRTSTLLAWLAQNEPEVLKKAHYCISCKDWIRYKLTGKIACEITDASAGILDLTTKQVSLEIFEALKIQEYIILIPEIINSTTIAGYTINSIEESCGLCSGIPVSGGLMDVVACPIGMGATNLGDVNTILGTACINGIVSDSFNTFEGYAGYTIFEDNNFLCLIGSMAGMKNIEWMKNSLLESYQQLFDTEQEFFENIDLQISNIDVGSNNIIYHPYIKESGERAPFRNPNARAGFFGISENTTIWHMVRSIYEGLALSIKDCLQGHNPKCLFLSGGGANSVQLKQIISDCLGIPVITQTIKELGAKGAAISGGIAVGYFEDYDDALLNFQTQSLKTLPNLQNKKKYDQLYTLYYQIRLEHDILWNKRAHISEY